MNEINMVPFIDVMLVLLIIFMVTAPMITTGTINVPRAGKSAKPPEQRMEVEMTADGKLNLRTIENNKVDAEESLEGISQAQLLAQIKDAIDATPGLPVALAADKDMKYDEVMKLMGELQQLGVERVGLTVKK
ncbi:ExbD/TolR family protein [Comamonas serinivorans]|nr:ExbD/TolR family protein [Comamonas serinivorans]